MKIQDLRVNPPSVRRPILLLGFSSTTDYIKKYRERVEVECQINSFAETLIIHSVHFSPESENIDVHDAVSSIYDWALEHNPVFVAGWLDSPALDTEGARAMLGAYARLLQRMGDPEFCLTHDAMLELSMKTKGLKRRSSLEMDRVWDMTERCAERHARIYTIEGDHPSLGAAFPLNRYRIRGEMTLKKQAA